ncbi:ectoine/hydroxyectoine ABC transporter permease subunit EhuD [Mesorhizobium sp. 43Arga]
MTWDWQFVAKILPDLLAGLLITIEATLLGSAMAMALGLFFAFAQRARSAAIRRAVRLFVEFIRRTPLLVQLYFLFYILPDLGIVLSPLSCGVLGLGLHYAAYTSEVYRAGIDNVTRGQWDAAKACNLSDWHTWWEIILPQAIPPMIPALANYFIAMFKETPILSVISLMEVMGVARQEANIYYRYLEPISMVGLLFLTVSIPGIVLTRHLDRIFNSERR